MNEVRLLVWETNTVRHQSTRVILQRRTKLCFARLGFNKGRNFIKWDWRQRVIEMTGVSESLEWLESGIGVIGWLESGIGVIRWLESGIGVIGMT